jgi:IS30 family transposase
MKKVNKLTDNDRDLIAIFHSQGVSARDIASKLGRNHTTISRELTRNRFGQHYVAIHAQYLTTQRKFQAGKSHTLKILIKQKRVKVDLAVSHQQSRS